MANYFQNISSKDELKQKFRMLCLELHPDKGGSHEEFIEMKEQYDNFDFTEIERETSFEIIYTLYGMMKDKNYKAGWVYFQFLNEVNKPSYEDFVLMARLLGYKKGWAYHKFHEFYDGKV